VAEVKELGADLKHYVKSLKDSNYIKEHGKT